MKTWATLLIFLVALTCICGSEPLHLRQSPSLTTVQALRFFRSWKKLYLRRGPFPGEAYVFVNADGHSSKGDGGMAEHSIAVSEGQGYGMLLTVLLDDSPTARLDFEALFLYCRHHPSPQSPDLMAWNQIAGGREAEDAESSSAATDADLDIAYALLLAQARWGGREYREQALHRLQAIWRCDFNSRNGLLGLGSFIDPAPPPLFLRISPLGSDDGPFSSLLSGHRRTAAGPNCGVAPGLS